MALTRIDGRRIATPSEAKRCPPLCQPVPVWCSCSLRRKSCVADRGCALSASRYDLLYSGKMPHSGLRPVIPFNGPESLQSRIELNGSLSDECFSSLRRNEIRNEKQVSKGTDVLSGRRSESSDMFSFMDVCERYYNYPAHNSAEARKTLVYCAGDKRALRRVIRWSGGWAVLDKSGGFEGCGRTDILAGVVSAAIAELGNP
ncbi:unnamed protein product [Toxocara canis]|uniref:Uncharacterized protein n=1 Tax=Toxocara canis TaxID=6265 RepID=A0A183UG65_TOXCA|nr:unnamed protein product [Toxocara canis]